MYMRCVYVNQPRWECKDKPMKFQDGANRIQKDFIGYGHLSKLYVYSYLLLQRNLETEPIEKLYR